MPEPDDIALLKQYAEDNSEAAFAGLVTRYVNLVYSAALRSVGNAHAAEEIAQAVFIILARKAGNLSKARRGVAATVLSGWLYQTARLTAANYLRGEIRRQNREQEAYMQAILNEPESDAWRQIAPLLDDAMGRLGEKDRNAIVLRFFENKNLSEVGAALGTSEDAAKMRVNRALDKLRKTFSKRGVTLSGAIIAGAVSANSVQAAPAGLAATISATAVKGAAVAATVSSLVKGTLKIMAYTKLKLAIGITAGILLAGGATTMFISRAGGDGKLAAQEIAKQAQNAYAALSSYSDNGTVEVEGVGSNSYNMTFNIHLARPNLYRIHWARAEAKVGLEPMTGTAWSDGTGDYVDAGFSGKLKKDDVQSALGLGAYVSGNSAINIPGTFFQQPWGDILSLTATGKVETKKEKDERIGGVDCYVISRVADAAQLHAEGMLPNMGNMGMAASTDVLWIGKQDHLIHQIRSSLDLTSITTQPQLSDAEAKRMLEQAKIPITPEAIARIKKGYENTAKSATRIMIKSGKIVFTETHENIVVNQKFSPADFAQ